MEASLFDTEKQRVRASFDRAAASYDGAAVLQREVSDRMAERPGYIRHQPQRVLDAGSGTGYGAQQLRQHYAAAQVIELDLAPRMLALSRDKQRHERGFFGRLLHKDPPLVCADLEALPLHSGCIDLVWSNLAIQWLNTPDTAFSEVQRVLRTGGLFMFATLGPDTLMELRQAFAGVDGHTHVNRFIDMHDIGDALVRTGFAEPVIDMEKIVLTYEDVKSVMRDLKAIGAHNAMAGRGRGLMGKRAWQQIEQRYETLRREGRLPATYEVIYGHAWKAEPKKPRALADGRQIIEFQPRQKTL